MARNNIGGNNPPRRSSRANIGIGGTVSNLTRFSAAIHPASVKSRQSQGFKYPQSQVSDAIAEEPTGLGAVGLSDAIVRSQGVPSRVVSRPTMISKAKTVPKRQPARKANLEVFPIPERPVNLYQLPAQPKPPMVTLTAPSHTVLQQVPVSTQHNVLPSQPKSVHAGHTATSNNMPPACSAVAMAAATPPASERVSTVDAPHWHKRRRPMGWSDNEDSNIEEFSDAESRSKDDFGVDEENEGSEDSRISSTLTEYNPAQALVDTIVRDNLAAEVALRAVWDKGKATERSVLNTHWDNNRAPKPPKPLNGLLPLTQYPGAGADRVGALVSKATSSSHKRPHRNTAVRPTLHKVSSTQLRFYDWRWQRVLEYAKLCFRCEITSYYAFPDIKLSKSLASESIMEALVEYNHNSHPEDMDTDDEYQPDNPEDNRVSPAAITDDMIELVHLDKSTFRGEIKTFIVNSMKGCDPLGLALPEEAVAIMSKTEYRSAIKQRIKTALKGYEYLHGTARNGSHLNYSHAFLRMMCIKYFYGEDHYVGQMFPLRFKSLPLEAVALMACVIWNGLESLLAKLSGNSSISFHAASYKATYDKHLDLLRDLDVDSVDGLILQNMLQEWADTGRQLSINGNDDLPSQDLENPIEDSYGVISQHQYNMQATHNAEAGPSNSGGR